MAAQYPEESIAGPRIARLIPQPIEYEPQIDRNEDGGADVNVQPCGMRAYLIEYDSLTAAELATLRAHFNDARGKVEAFSFYNRQTATLLADCYYREWQKGKHKKTWANVLSATIWRFE